MAFLEKRMAFGASLSGYVLSTALDGIAPMENALFQFSALRAEMLGDMRVATGIPLLLIGVGLIALAQTSRKWDRRPEWDRPTPDDPIWGLPLLGRLIATVGILLGALGAALLTIR